MAVTKRTRFEILRRDGNRCRYCGRSVDDGIKLTIDHVVPVALGGTDDPSNLVAACADCNAGKTSIQPDSPLVAQVEEDAIRWAAARKKALLYWHIEQDLLNEDIDRFEADWGVWTFGPADDRQQVPKDRGWRDTVARLLDEGLTNQDLDRMIRSAMERKGVTPANTWRYFCGIAYRTLDRLQETTTDYLREED